jgi:hypothetical protein
MNVVLTLDYEIYFGRATGRAERTLIAPTEALAALARKHGVPLVFFVDACWLLRLREEGRRHATLMAEHDAVCRQLQALDSAGHELQLHVHPHWEDAHWDDGAGAWQMDMRRYRLQSFFEPDIRRIVGQTTALLRGLAPNQPVLAYRAGGWYLQPFAPLHGALREHGIRIDSTVYPGGVQDRDGHRYDFRKAPALSRWRFEHDPLVPDAKGGFLEVPIASHEVSPWLYWRLALARLYRGGTHRTFGEGTPMAPGKGDLARKLFTRSTSVVSMDGVKSGFMSDALRAWRARGHEDFVVIGHPKSFTPHSLGNLERFIERHRDERFVGLNGYAAELSG